MQGKKTFHASKFTVFERNSKKIIKIEIIEGQSLGYSRNMLYFCHRNWFAIPPIFTFLGWSGGFLLSPTKVQNFYHITNQLVIKFLNIWRHSLVIKFLNIWRHSLNRQIWLFLWLFLGLFFVKSRQIWLFFFSIFRHIWRFFWRFLTISRQNPWVPISACLEIYLSSTSPLFTTVAIFATVMSWRSSPS